MTILDYAETRSVTVPAVHQAIKRYPEELEGHISNEGKKKILDQFAIDFLDSHIRLPSLVIDDKLALTFREREVGIREELVNAKNETITERDTTRKKVIQHFDGGIKALMETLAHLEENSQKIGELNDSLDRISVFLDKQKEQEAAENRIREMELKVKELESQVRSKEEIIEVLKAEVARKEEKLSKSVWKKLFGKK